jgi:hypothetical protein
MSGRAIAVAELRIRMHAPRRSQAPASSLLDYLLRVSWRFVQRRVIIRGNGATLLRTRLIVGSTSRRSRSPMRGRLRRVLAALS